MSSFLLYWIQGAFWTLVLLIGTELISAAPPSPSSKEESKIPHPVVMTLGWLLVWPLFLALMILSFFHGHSLLEQMTHWADKMDAFTLQQKQQLRAKKHEIREKVRNLPRLWVPGSTLIWGPTQVLCRGQGMVTHFIIIQPHQVFCLRATTLPANCFIWAFAPTLEEAQAICEADLDWAVLCIKGAEKEQEEYRLKCVPKEFQ